MTDSTMRRIATLAVTAFILCLVTASAFRGRRLRPRRTPPPPVPNKGDTAWMLAASAMVLCMTVPGPRAVLRRPGALKEHAVGAAAGVLHDLRRLCAVGALRLQPGLLRRRVVQRLRRRGFPKRSSPGSRPTPRPRRSPTAVVIPELVLRPRSQMTFAAHHPGP